MNPKYQKIFQYVAIPLLALVFYFVLIFIARWLGFPGPKVIIAWAERYYEQYGYAVVLIGALAEGTLFINWYLPGSIVVALGAVFARTAGLNIFLMLIMVIIGFYSTALLNYVMGRFGWYHVFIKLGLKEPLLKVQAKMEDKGLKILFTTYVHPNFGALSATSAGILRMDFYKFALYTLISIIIWNSFWTTIFYWFGAGLLEHLNILIIAGGVFVYIMFAKSFKKKSEDGSGKETPGHINLP